MKKSDYQTGKGENVLIRWSMKMIYGDLQDLYLEERAQEIESEVL